MLSKIRISFFHYLEKLFPFLAKKCDLKIVLCDAYGFPSTHVPFKQKYCSFLVTQSDEWCPNRVVSLTGHSWFVSVLTVIIEQPRYT